MKAVARANAITAGASVPKWAVHAGSESNMAKKKPATSEWHDCPSCGEMACMVNYCAICGHRKFTTLTSDQRQQLQQLMDMLKPAAAAALFAHS